MTMPFEVRNSASSGHAEMHGGSSQFLQYSGKSSPGSTRITRARERDGPITLK